eukprot:3447449-Pleurochrysis_carterae.AAC.1
MAMGQSESGARWLPDATIKVLMSSYRRTSEAGADEGVGRRGEEQRWRRRQPKPARRCTQYPMDSYINAQKCCFRVAVECSTAEP